MDTLLVIVLVIASALGIGAALGISLVTAGATFRYVMAPISKLPLKMRAKPRFVVIDFFCLIALLQISLIPIVYIRQVDRHIGLVILWALVWYLVVKVWWESVKRLTALGIRRSWRRTAFQLIVTPAAYLSAVFAALFLLVLCGGLIAFVFGGYAEAPLAFGEFFLGMLSSSAVAMLTLRGVRYLASWVVRGATPIAADADARYQLHAGKSE